MFGYNSSSTKVRNTVACYGYRPKFLYSVSTTYEDPRAAVAGSGSVSCHLPRTAANCMLNKAGPVCVCGLGLGCPTSRPSAFSSVAVLSLRFHGQAPRFSVQFASVGKRSPFNFSILHVPSKGESGADITPYPVPRTECIQFSSLLFCSIHR